MSLTAAATRSAVESFLGANGSAFTQTSSLTIQGGLGSQTFTTQAGESLETLFQQVNGSGIGVTMSIDQTSGQWLIYNNNYGIKGAANTTGVNQVAVSNATGDFAGGAVAIPGGLNIGFDKAFTAGSVDQNLKFLQAAGVDVAAVNAVVTFEDPGHIGSGVPNNVTLGGGYTVATGQGQNSDIITGSQGMAGTTVALMNPGVAATSNSWTVTENNALEFQVGANANQTVNLNIDATSSQSLGVTSLDVLTTSDAETAITQLDRAIQSVSTVRANMGAIINRLTNSMNNDSSAGVNAAAANSRIKDVNVASETVNFTRDQILLQAGTAVLAQANQAPTSILSLLR